MELRNLSQPPIEQLAHVLLRHASRDPRLLSRSSEGGLAACPDELSAVAPVANAAPEPAERYPGHCYPGHWSPEDSYEELLVVAAACADEAAAARRLAKRAVRIAAAVALAGVAAGLSGLWLVQSETSAARQSAAALPNEPPRVSDVADVPLPPLDQPAPPVGLAADSAPVQPAPPAAENAGSEPPAPAPTAEPKHHARVYWWRVVHHTPARRTPVPPATLAHSVLSYDTYSGGAG